MNYRNCRKLNFILLIVWCLHSGCIKPAMSEECREFFSLPLDQHGKLISSFPLDKQIRLYRCGLDRQHPETSLAIFIAEEGESAIPFLLERLQSENDELTQVGIIDIFRVMSLKGYLRNRPDIIRSIRKVQARRTMSTFKEIAKESLETIEKNSAG